MNLRDLDIGGVRPFDVNSDPSSLYADGKGLIIVPDKDDNKVQRRALLLHCAGPDVQDMFYILVDTGSAKDYQKAEDALSRHFVTQINTPYERHLFREIVQGEDETIDQFAPSNVGTIEEAAIIIKCVSRTTKKFYAYGAVTPLEVIGTFTTDLSLGSKSVSTEVSVIKGQGEPLLGRESALELGVLKLQVPLNCVARVDHSELTTRFKEA
ncbi:hypothetical protein P5673_024409 [Acropora cervicornis]|uniref:Uncharacterized protein n=1 Tax=Acropora cervicornis TaxID=6130 RepID=A0AAD9Q3I2_ACRCE|nr:hypothetical protein P5673_024409 [Acropora cervicornis]